MAQKKDDMMIERTKEGKFLSKLSDSIFPDCCNKLLFLGMSIQNNTPGEKRHIWEV